MFNQEKNNERIWETSEERMKKLELKKEEGKFTEDDERKLSELRNFLKNIKEKEGGEEKKQPGHYL